MPLLCVIGLVGQALINRDQINIHWRVGSHCSPLIVIWTISLGIYWMKGIPSEINLSVFWASHPERWIWIYLRLKKWITLFIFVHLAFFLSGGKCSFLLLVGLWVISTFVIIFPLKSSVCTVIAVTRLEYNCYAGSLSICLELQQCKGTAPRLDREWQFVSRSNAFVCIRMSVSSLDPCTRILFKYCHGNHQV